MPKKKWLSRHRDGRHFPVDYPDKSDLPKGNMKEIEPKDESIDEEKEITGEEYTQEMYPEYNFNDDETPEEAEDREIIEEIGEESSERDRNAFRTRALELSKHISTRAENGLKDGEGKANELGSKLRREIRKMILKRS